MEQEIQKRKVGHPATGKVRVNDIDNYTAWTPKQLKNFWRKVDKNGPVPAHRPELGPCWIWTGGNTGEKKGYGSFFVLGIMRPAHRVSWLINKGPIPASTEPGYHGTCVLHACDSRSCVNPSHLFLGTHTDNMRDMEAKGRSDHPSGERNGMVKHPEARLTGDKNWTRKFPEKTLKGEAHGEAKLTEDQVKYIRSFGRYVKQRMGPGSPKLLANELNVSVALINKIKAGDAWKHLKSE